MSKSKQNDNNSDANVSMSRTRVKPMGRTDTIQMEDIPQSSSIYTYKSVSDSTIKLVYHPNSYVSLTLQQWVLMALLPARYNRFLLVEMFE